jgi:hypothetical protein
MNVSSWKDTTLTLRREQLLQLRRADRIVVGMAPAPED